jgi:predicted DNA-binding transcriptional regulator YafY
MTQTARIHKIKNLLRHGKPVSFSTLLHALEVSRSTLKRDLEALRNEYNMPIEWDRAAGGYALAHAANQPGDPHELPGLWFSPTEIHALLTMQHLLAHVDRGGLLTPHIEPLMQRLNSLLGNADADAAQVRRRVHIIGLAQRAVQPQHFQSVGTALVQRKRLQITYLARGKGGEQTQRQVSPLRLVRYRENWHLDAWCHMRKSLRNFAVDRIQHATILNTPAKEVRDDKLDATFGPSYGIFSGGRVQWAQLRFTPERAEWVKDERWHSKQQGKLQPDGSYQLRIPYTDHRELIMDILKHGAHCEVLGPPSLRQEVAAEVRRMGEKYF